MKNKLLQLYVYINNIDRRYIQWAHFVFMVGMLLMQVSTEDGGGGTHY